MSDTTPATATHQPVGTVTPGRERGRPCWYVACVTGETCVRYTREEADAQAALQVHYPAYRAAEKEVWAHLWTITTREPGYAVACAESAGNPVAVIEYETHGGRQTLYAYGPTCPAGWRRASRNRADETVERAVREIACRRCGVPTLALD